MSAAKIKIAAKMPARAGALVVVEGNRLRQPLAKEIARQWQHRKVAVTATLGMLPYPILVAVKTPDDAGPLALGRLFGAAGRALLEEKVSTAAVVLPSKMSAGTAEAVILGLGRALYRFDRYQTRDASPMPAVRVVAPDAAWAREARRALDILDGVLLTRDLINTPAEDMGPDELEEEARRVAKQTGMRVRVLQAARCAQMGMGALTAVGRASTRPPRLISLEYRGAPRSKDVLALAGKGICFDTGGLDLKPADGMLLMKKDMGGAAALLGTALAVGRIQPKRNLRFYLAVAENSVSGNAIRPGDILTALDGTTIEIGHTDAEGRLVLADAVALARREGATRIIDVATLTGAALIALGRIRVPMLSNDSELRARIEAAAEVAGEKVWHFPADPEYREQIQSKIADIKNVGKGREAGVIAAGLFVAHFAGDLPWAHLDISPAAWSESANDLGPEGATGVMVPTLTHVACD
jgi:leucyl aminopeptidase